MMSFSEAVRTCLHKYVDFEGRATRAEYWWFNLFVVLITLVACIPLIYGCVEAGATGLLEDNPENFDTASIIWMCVGLILIGLVALGLLLPSLAVTVRRLHDINKSGWWYFISFVPYVGGFVLLVFTLLPSSGDNQYGPDPYAPRSANDAE